MRLRPDTGDRPKALIEIGGASLLEHTLASLAGCGVTHVVIVTGHGRQRVTEFIARWRGAIRIEERFNPRFSETNNAISLACAADHLLNGAWIVETDVIAEPAAWQAIAGATAGDARWLAAPFSCTHDGALLLADATLRLRQWLLRRSAGSPVPSCAFKSMGVLTVGPTCGARLASWLAIAAAQRRDGIYFDQVLAEHLDDCDVHVVDAGEALWAEIDSVEDLNTARRLFGGEGSTK